MPSLRQLDDPASRPAIGRSATNSVVFVILKPDFIEAQALFDISANKSVGYSSNIVAP